MFIQRSPSCPTHEIARKCLSRPVQCSPKSSQWMNHFCFRYFSQEIVISYRQLTFKMDIIDVNGKMHANWYAIGQQRQFFPHVWRS